MPAVSLIIPTHNRSAALRRTLDALRLQTYPFEKIEIIVVADGCTDDTVKMLQAYETILPVQIVEESCQGPGAARNRGGTHARGQLVIFLDDDIEPDPCLIEGHVGAHEQWADSVVVGPYPPVLGSRKDLFGVALRHWWEAMFDAMAQPGHRYTFHNLLSGNLSMEAKLFRSLGGFNVELLCHEDYELGVRLIKAGIPIVFVAQAKGYHHETADVNRALQRKYEEGRADVLMGKRHPDIRSILPLARFTMKMRPWDRLLCSWAFGSPTVARGVIACLKQVVGLLERVRFRYYWRLALNMSFACSYWLGVAKELGTLQGLKDFLKDCSLPANESGSVIDLDLREGIETAERRLDSERPGGVVIHYGNQLVGRILPQPGSEPLKGVHLRPVLATRLAKPLMKALILEGAVGLNVDTDHLLAAGRLKSVDPKFANVTAL